MFDASLTRAMASSLLTVFDEYLKDVKLGLVGASPKFHPEKTVSWWSLLRRNQ